MTVNETEAAVIRRIFDLYLQGYGTPAISKILNEDGVPRRHGHEKWLPTSIIYILNNEPLQRVLGLNSVCPTIIARGAGCYHRGMILFSPYENGTKDMRSNFNVPIRVLTTLECWRLMGFTDKDFEKARQALNNTYYKGKDKSSSQLYKQAGNSIVTNCLIAIFYCMFFENSTNYEKERGYELDRTGD